MKYKIVGWINLILGSLLLLQQIGMLFLVYPKLSYLYKEFGPDLPTSTKIYPYTTAVAIIFLSGVIWIGAKLAFNKIRSNNYFRLGITALVILFLFGGYYFSTQLLSVISPLYSITSNLQP